MERLDVSVSWLISSSGAYVLIEPMIYWRDSLDPLHMKYLSPKNRERFANFTANIEARSFVRALRLQLRDVMDAHGASHSQIGRFYELANTLDENAMRVIEKIKSLLDPAGLMNPGVLGPGRSFNGSSVMSPDYRFDPAKSKFGIRRDRYRREHVHARGDRRGKDSDRRAVS
jgi:hypothetical protein